ncbi:uncharacterized protein PV09_06398 [Verruconis gallopava]|uniref:DNA-directed RNA polymerase subunit n=1 Tax=Verruconis gallopava TaxID=253628 RepID=A0A0D1XIU5_9PEZI|nr:uncharacterized protein PV09_06398 [Verruconis gallopava]KIW02246.1 hypothetical protein PV09_06398 [Verruconis gallopava]
MANLNFAHSSAPLKTIKEIQFGLFSPEEVKEMSIGQIVYPETMDDAKQFPRKDGLGDPRMGSIDRGFECASCHENMQECPGHFGHIELATPVFHVGFIRRIQKILECFCKSCHKLLVDENNPQFRDALRTTNPKRRFDQIHKLCKTKKICEPPSNKVDPQDEEFGGSVKKQVPIGHDGCGAPQPEVRKEGLALYYITKHSKKDEENEGREPDKELATPAHVYERFDKIDNATWRTLGMNVEFAHPKWMIISNLLVPPPPVRPSVSMDGTGQGMRGEDDLTYKLGDIIRANANVKRCQEEGSPAHVTREFETLLQYHVATYMDNNIAGQPPALQKSGRPLKTIRSRLKGKEGRLRGNLMGKRVDFSARTVITGDPNLDLDQVGVPKSTACILTYPETVTPYNIQRLHQLVRNGSEHPGARYVIRDTGERIDLKHHKRAGEIALQYGWKVERHIVDDDYVIFNRQPSLHKESMMGHRVKVMPYSTFRLNLSVTSPYNADFDGDEMNLHVPQSEETRAEVKELCMVPLQIVSPQRNGPLMGIVQDTLCGIYKICKRDVFIDKDQVQNILMWVPDWDGTIPTPAILKPKPLWTGKQIISLALPESLNLMRDNDPLPPKDGSLLVYQGELLYGLFAKATVGASGGGVVHTIYNQEGWPAAVKFFNAAQRIVCYWLLHHGFSIGVGDTIPDPETAAKIQEAIDAQKAEVEKVVKKATKDQLDPLPGMNIRETFENMVQAALNTARDNAGTIATKHLKECNNAVAMANSGSKGSKINIAQMSALVGQTSVEGKRIAFGFQYRTLPHFTKDDYSPESRGFVENSYLRGLTPHEFFFHAMSGREGLIDTAVKTAETGYIQRRLVKALEDCSVKYDGTVRNSLGDILQFIYGEDGLDAQYIEKQKVDVIRCSDEVFDSYVRVDVTDETGRFQIDEQFLECAREIEGDVEVQRYFDEEYAQLLEDRKFLRGDCSDDEEQKQLPLNILRIIESGKAKFNIKRGARSDLHPAEAIPLVRQTLDNLMVIRGEDSLSIEAQKEATLLFKAHLRTKLAFKRLVMQHGLNKLALASILGELENRFLRAAVAPGDMVGVLAAQSIGEPATQMTLNTFHFAGVASKNVTLGVPRLKEILNIATNLKTPSMYVYQVEENRRTQEGAKRLRSMVEHATLKSVTAMTEIHYDPDPTATVIEEDVDLVESYFIVPDENEDLSRQSKWMLRIVLDDKKLLDRDMRVSDVAAKIKEQFQADLAVIFSDDNADLKVIRMRMINNDDTKDDEDEMVEGENVLKKVEMHILDNLTLRGVEGVTRAFIDKRQRVVKEPDGSLAKKENHPDGTEWFLNTSGINLKKVLEIEGVDPYRTYCNSVMDIFTVFGIEAARAALAKELHMVLSFDGSYVNHRHLAMLVDVMTSKGYLMAITRHGINREQTGALMRCSFEETVEILLEAAAQGEIDDCRGISENVMLGQLAPLGTGDFDVQLDYAMLETAHSDNARYGLMPGVASGSNYVDQGAATPYDIGSPSHEGAFGGGNFDSAFSPIVQSGGTEGGGFPNFGGGISPYGPDYAGAASPGWGTSPGYIGGTSPTSPNYSPTSPGYSPTSPAYNLTSPAYGGTSPSSPAYTPTSPTYSPTSPAMSYSPTSPSYSPTSPAYSPTSPKYSPTSPAMGYSPTSPTYSPTSPQYSPTSPKATSPRYSPTSPTYSPTSPAYNSPTSPVYSPTSPAFGGDRRSPTSPVYSPTSPAISYSPTSPKYSPTSPAMAGSGQGSSSPKYSPTSPSYSPTSPK